MWGLCAIILCGMLQGLLCVDLKAFHQRVRGQIGHQSVVDGVRHHGAHDLLVHIGLDANDLNLVSVLLDDQLNAVPDGQHKAGEDVVGAHPKAHFAANGIGAYAVPEIVGAVIQAHVVLLLPQGTRHLRGNLYVARFNRAECLQTHLWAGIRAVDL